jgi:uncharacterized protein YprB with RNaseH-like and TPR domain
VLRRTFQLIRGVGPSREKELWSRGLRTWDQFPAPGGEVGLSARQDDAARRALDEARLALERRELKRLAELLPPREHWRLYPEFLREAVFFDIETDGRENNAPTVVSLFHREGFEVFIRGRNLEELPRAIARWPMWVTFNGSVYDVPVLRQHFGELPEPEAHLDLRFICRRFGLRGGLKKLEDQLGIARPRHLRGVDGLDAVLLWRAYKASADLEALRLLVEYNLYDSIQLRSVMELTYNHAIERLGQDAPRLPVFERGDVLYDITRYLLAISPDTDDLKLLERIRRFDRDLAAL